MFEGEALALGIGSGSTSTSNATASISRLNYESSPSLSTASIMSSDTITERWCRLRLPLLVEVDAVVELSRLRLSDSVSTSSSLNWLHTLYHSCSAWQV